MSDENVIVVESGPKRLEFPDVDALAAHVQEILATRGGVFAPLELACFRALEAHANGSTPPEVARTLRAISIYTPPRPKRPPTPYDERIAEAVELRDQREAELAEALEHREAVRAGAEAELAEAKRRSSGSSSDGHHIAALRGQLQERVREANEEYIRANGAAVRARARVNARKMERDRWIAVEEYKRTSQK